jgi:predicted PurR-regulated permease PerM
MSIWGLLTGRRRNGHVERPNVTVVAAEQNDRSPWMAGVFVLALFGCLYVGRQLFIPVALALLFALVLAPGVHALARWHIPPVAGAGVVLALFLGFFALGGYLLSSPVRTWVERAPEIQERVSGLVSRAATPFRRINRTIAPKASETTSDQPLKVEVKQHALWQRLMPQAGSALGTAGTTFILLYFLLASGDRLLVSIISNIAGDARQAQVALIGNEVKQHVSKYLSTITVINLGEGCLISGGLWLAGMPTPLLWGAMHAVLNFIPYIGAITGLAITTLVAIVSFDTIPRMIIPPAIYFSVMFLDNFASPLLLGKRLILNPIIVFLSLMVWGWQWGVAGVLIAVPVLIAAKIVCDHVPNVRKCGRIISAELPDEEVRRSFS